ncbi:hypothetical protein, partial [Streptomyces sp. NPDC051098]|uniref:hypothetical protein n=1 Tax=Streptomyces sp. NPDC051098 TaxID=3155411 RepID=UPI00343559C1
GFPRDAHPMAMLSSVVSALSTFYQDSHNPFVDRLQRPGQGRIEIHRSLRRRNRPLRGRSGRGRRYGGGRHRVRRAAEGVGARGDASAQHRRHRHRGEDDGSAGARGMAGRHEPEAMHRTWQTAVPRLRVR